MNTSNLQLLDKFLQSSLINKLSFSNYVKNTAHVSSFRQAMLRISMIGIIYLLFQLIVSVLFKNQLAHQILGDPSYLIRDMDMINTCLAFCVTFAAISIQAFRINEDRRSNYWVEPLDTILEQPSDLLMKLKLRHGQLRKLMMMMRIFPLFKLTFMVLWVNTVFFFMGLSIFGCYKVATLVLCGSFILRGIIISITCYVVSYTC